MKKTLVLVALLSVVSMAAAPKADTSLVLKPSAAQLKAAKPATNKICPISKEAIGSMGAGYNVIYKGQTVVLCCKGCVKSFAKNPAKFTADVVPAKSESQTAK
jgi:YHS domain-containing protein